MAISDEQLVRAFNKAREQGDEEKTKQLARAIRARQQELGRSPDVPEAPDKIEGGAPPDTSARGSVVLQPELAPLVGIGARALNESDLPENIYASLVEAAANINEGMFLGDTEPTIPGVGTIGTEDLKEEDFPRPVKEGFQFIGETIPFLAGSLGVGAKLLNRGVGFLGQRSAGAVNSLFQEATKTAATRPASFVGGEAVGAFGAGVGRGSLPEDAGPVAKATAELLGAVAPAGTIAGAAALGSRLPLVQTARNAARTVAAARKPKNQSPEDLVAGQPEAAREANQRLREAIPNPREAALRSEQADVLEDAPLTLGEKADEPGMLAMEKSVVKGSEKLELERQERFSTINQVIRGELEGFTDSPVAPGQSADPEAARAYLESVMDARLDLARTRLDEEIAEMGDSIDPATANQKARELLDDAYNDVKKDEDAIWERVPDGVFVPRANTRKAYEDFLKRAKGNRVERGAIRESIPDIVKKNLGGVNKKGNLSPGPLLSGRTPNVKEFQSLRSRIADEVREERAQDAPDRRKIDLLTDLQTALLEDMSQVDKVNDQLQVALGFSREVARKFHQGHVGQLLGFRKTGAGRIDDRLTLRRTIGAAKEGGVAGRDDLLDAVRERSQEPAMRKVMQDFLAEEFRRAAAPGGDFKLSAARNYLNRRQDVLEEFPELRQRIQGAIEAGNARVATEEMRSPRKSAAGVILNSPVEKEVRNLFRSQRPGENTRSLLNQLEQDPTGEAKEGFRQAVVNELMRISSSANTEDLAGGAIINGRALKNAVESPGVRRVLDQALTKDQRKRLNTIVNTASAAERGRRARPSPEGVIALREGPISRGLRQVGAAMIGRAVVSATGSGGNVQIPGIFVRTFDELQRRGLEPARVLIADAILAEDDRLFKALINKETTAQTQRQSRQLLQEWAQKTALEYGVDLTEKRVEEQSQHQPQQRR